LIVWTVGFSILDIYLILVLIWSYVKSLLSKLSVAIIVSLFGSTC